MFSSFFRFRFSLALSALMPFAGFSTMAFAVIFMMLSLRFFMLHFFLDAEFQHTPTPMLPDSAMPSMFSSLIFFALFRLSLLRQFRYIILRCFHARLFSHAVVRLFAAIIAAAEAVAMALPFDISFARFAFTLPLSATLFFDAFLRDAVPLAFR